MAEEKPLEESVYDSPSTVTAYLPAIATDDAAEAAAELPPEETPEPAEEAPSKPLPTFDPKWRDPLTGLLFLGALKEEFEWVGHRFTVRTLNNLELADVALVAARYKDTDYSAKAYQCAVVAACITAVDGKPLPTMPLDNQETSDVSAKFDYIMARWFPTTIDVVFTHYYDLEIKVREVLDAMGKASG